MVVVTGDQEAAENISATTESSAVASKCAMLLASALVCMSFYGCLSLWFRVVFRILIPEWVAHLVPATPCSRHMASPKDKMSVLGFP